MNTKYNMIIETLEQDILACIDQNINKLPSERSLSEKYNVSRQTIRTALQNLEERQIINRIQGSGIFITGVLPNATKNTVALILPSDSDYLYPSIISNIKKKLSENGLTTLLYLTHDKYEEERRILENFLSDTPRCIVVHPISSCLSTPNKDLFEKLYINTPILFFGDHYLNLQNIPYIDEENYMGGYLLGQYLFQKSHKNIAGIFMNNSLVGDERCNGLIKSALDFNLQINTDRIYYYTKENQLNLDRTGNTSFLVKIATQLVNNYVDAVVCQNDEIAYHLIKELQLTNISIPEDISVISFDNSYLSDFSNIPITSAYHKKQSIEDAIIASIMNKLRGGILTSSTLSWDIDEKQSVSSI